MIGLVRGHLRIVESLLDRGANIEANFNKGSSLMMACFSRSYRSCKASAKSRCSD